MRSQLRTITHGDKTYEALAFWCPGCAQPFADMREDERHSGLHMLPVNTTATSPSWDWDGNLEAPTLAPSILTRSAHKRRNVDGQVVDVGEFVCHSFLRAGVFEFLGDCTHPLAGQSVPMGELPEWATR